MSEKLVQFVGDLTTNDTIALATIALSSLQDADAITTVLDWAKDEDLLDELQARVDEAVEKVDNAKDAEGDADEPEEEDEEEEATK